jgi:hypothetical protein
MASLQLGPGKAAELAVVGAKVSDAGSHFAKGELEGASILAAAEVLVHVEGGNGTKGGLGSE